MQIFLYQMKEVAVTVVVWVTESQTVRNWRLFKASKHQILAAEIIWQATPPIGKLLNIGKETLYLLINICINSIISVFNLIIIV